jgi:hypothetical protein
MHHVTLGLLPIHQQMWLGLEITSSKYVREQINNGINTSLKFQSIVNTGLGNGICMPLAIVLLHLLKAYLLLMQDFEQNIE